MEAPGCASEEGTRCRDRKYPAVCSKIIKEKTPVRDGSHSWPSRTIGGATPTCLFILQAFGKVITCCSRYDIDYFQDKCKYHVDATIQNIYRESSQCSRVIWTMSMWECEHLAMSKNVQIMLNEGFLFLTVSITLLNQKTRMTAPKQRLYMASGSQPLLT